MEKTFAQKVKTELCEPRVERKCCAVAEAYGVLLYAHSFSPRSVRIRTASDEFAERLPHLFRRAFGIGFDEPEAQRGVKHLFSIQDPDKLKTIFDAFGNDMASPSLHINFGVIEEPCCKAAFVRGAFLAGGSVTDPAKRYHLELATTHYSVSREAYSVLLEMGFSPKEAQRKGEHLLYFKKSEHIEDLLTTIGAPVCAMDVMSAKIEKDMKNSINRKVNCDSANADKVVEAAARQMEAIRRIDKLYGLDSLPDKLQEAALLRYANPEASLADLAMLSYPPVSKSCLSHRLKKLLTYTPEEE